MSSAIELIVKGFVKLKDRQALEWLRDHRRRLLAELRDGRLHGDRLAAELELDVAIITDGLRNLEPGPWGRATSDSNGER